MTSDQQSFDRAAFIEQWCQALESGRYERGTEKLCYKLPSNGHKRYCCLGVAAHELVDMGRAEVRPSLYQINEFEFGLFLEEDSDNLLLTSPMVELLGIPNDGEFYADKVSAETRKWLAQISVTPSDEERAETLEEMGWDNDMNPRLPTLVDVNDSKHPSVSFKRIAALIREIEAANAWSS